MKLLAHLLFLAMHAGAIVDAYRAPAPEPFVIDDIEAIQWVLKPDLDDELYFIANVQGVPTYLDYESWTDSRWATVFTPGFDVETCRYLLFYHDRQGHCWRLLRAKHWVQCWCPDDCLTPREVLDQRANAGFWMAPGLGGPKR